jgi:hypothetical protein
VSPQRFVQCASVFVLAVALAFPRQARADGDLFSSDPDPQIPVSGCVAGGPGSASCSLGMPFMSCTASCQSAFYACCKYDTVIFPVCGCVYAP